MLICLVAVLIFSYAVACALDEIERRAQIWYGKNSGAPSPLYVPWYVRFYEFLSKRD